MKIKRMICVIAMLAIAVSAFSGCAADPIQEDLKNYINVELATYTTLQSTVQTELASAMGENFVDIETTHTILLNVLPKSESLVETAKAIKTTTPEVTALHAKCIAALTAQDDAIKAYIAAIEANDADLVVSTNAAIDDVIAQYESYLVDATAMMKAHGLEINSSASK